MGWNIFYKECKYIAAHYVLKELNKQKQKFALSTFGAEKTDMNDIEPTPQWTTLKHLKSSLPIFPMHMIKDAAFMLYNTSDNPIYKEIDLLNSNKISEIQLKILWEGNKALKDRKYWRLFFGSIKIIIPTVIAITTAIIGTINCLIK